MFLHRETADNMSIQFCMSLFDEKLCSAALVSKVTELFHVGGYMGVWL